MDGGLIIQESQPLKIKGKGDLKPAETTYKGETYKVSRAPTEKELEDMLFGWYVESGVSSNSALFVKDGATVAIGTGEQDRVGVVEIAAFKAYTKFMDGPGLQEIRRALWRFSGWRRRQARGAWMT